MAVADRRIVVAGTLLRRRMALVQLPDLTVQMLTVLMVAVQPPEAVLAGGRQVEAVTARMTAVCRTVETELTLHDIQDGAVVEGDAALRGDRGKPLTVVEYFVPKFRRACCSSSCPFTFYDRRSRRFIFFYSLLFLCGCASY